MGVDLGGRLIVGCEITHCIDQKTGDSLADILRNETQADPVTDVYGEEYIRNHLSLHGFIGYNAYSPVENHEPFFVGKELCNCGNRGEPLAGICSMEDVIEAANEVEETLQKHGFSGPVEVVILLEGS